MKKTYEKPVLVRKGKLSAVVAGPSVIVNGSTT
ncbi:putative RiPP precursor [Mesorhizobium sp. CA8]|nr:MULTISPECIES: putative RiPP precursor [unclassified Mesorhizobium]MBZ9763179.1 putative RiPP precursor [Mesorhizobium sp. CA8]MBZ9823105.1 putative RiPP precursor [Mesorhizobium sp. CA4]